MRTVFLLSLVLLEVSSLCGIKKFFLATIPPGVLIRDKFYMQNLYNAKKLLCDNVYCTKLYTNKKELNSFGRQLCFIKTLLSFQCILYCVCLSVNNKIEISIGQTFFWHHLGAGNVFYLSYFPTLPWLSVCNYHVR